MLACCQSSFVAFIGINLDENLGLRWGICIQQDLGALGCDAFCVVSGIVSKWVSYGGGFRRFLDLSSWF